VDSSNPHSKELPLRGVWIRWELGRSAAPGDLGMDVVIFSHVPTTGADLANAIANNSPGCARIRLD